MKKSLNFSKNFSFKIEEFVVTGRLFNLIIRDSTNFASARNLFFNGKR